MIKYPNGQKQTSNSKNKTNNNFANRGLSFENEINITNDYYRNNNLALIYKKPTPIKVVKMENTGKRTHIIKEAYFETPSTTDYCGLYKEKYLDFEAKETRNKNHLPFANLKKQQIEHMRHVKKHNGIGFIIVHFRLLDQIYLLDYEHVLKEYDEKKSRLLISLFKEKGHEVKRGYLTPIEYLKVVEDIYFKE